MDVYGLTIFQEIPQKPDSCILGQRIKDLMTLNVFLPSDTLACICYNLGTFKKVDSIISHFELLI